MSKLQKAKEIIEEYANDAPCGIFDTRNFVGDTMREIYNDGELHIDICYHYQYFEVFGLSDIEFEELEKHYDALNV